MNSITDKLLELNKSIEILNLELKKNHNTKSKDDPEYISDEYIAKVQSVISNLDTYNFHNYTLRHEINNLYLNTNNLSVTESIVVGLIKSIVKYDIDEKKKKNFLSFNDIVGSSINIVNKEDFDRNKKIFLEVEKVVMQILKRHKYYHLPDDQITDKIDIEQCMNNLKNMKSSIEFLFIRVIIMGITNYTQNFINNLYQKSEENNSDSTNNKKKDEKEKQIELDPDIYREIFIEYVYIRDNSYCLEKHFQEYLNEFRNKHNLNFTMQDLLGDIFWDIIFHDKNICEKFVNLYTKKESCNEEVKDMIKNIYNILIGLKNPIKDKILDLLSLNNLAQNKISLINIILNQQILNHDLIHKEIMSYFDGRCIYCKRLLVNNNQKNKEIIVEKNNDNNNVNNLDNKTVEEIYNYINEDSDNKKKKKRRNKKRKNKKIEIEIEKKIKEDKNETVIEKEDLIVNEFKQFIIDNIIDANKINKIKPVISQNFLNIISDKY